MNVPANAAGCINTFTDEPEILDERGVNVPRQNGTVIDSLVSRMRDASNLDRVPILIKRIIREEMWKCFRIPNLRETYRQSTFADFVQAPIYQGLGTSLESIKNLCQNDIEAQKMIDEALQGKHGGGHNPYGCKGRPNISHDAQEDRDEQRQTGRSGINFDNVQVDSPKAPTGNTRQRALRKLRQEAEKEGASEKVKDIYRRVMAEEISPHKGMVEAGFRKVPTALDQLRKAWKKATTQERLQFLKEVSESK